MSIKVENLSKAIVTPFDLNSVPTIPEFYRNKNVFITGGTGFMGKVLIEKLLRSCPDLNSIYVLIRPKKGQNANERSKKIVDALLFDTLRATNPKVFSKLKGIAGDVTELKLGMSADDLKLIKENVSIVFHVAASVRFDDPLKKSILMNTRGTREIVEIAKEMKLLEVLVHISTTYCNIDKPVIDEVVYPPRADWRSMIEIAENTDEKILNTLQAKILNDFPNTYTFTKSLAEDIIKEASKSIPAIICRPSVVIVSRREPDSGWVDSMNGPMGLVVGGGLGVLHCVYAKKDINADYVAVDLAINMMIVASWYKAVSKENKNECLVFNGATSNYKPIQNYKLTKFMLKINEDCPFNKTIWYPFVIFISNKYLYLTSVFLFHIIPAVIIDTILNFNGKKIRLMPIYRKIFHANDALKTFMFNQWEFKTDNFVALQSVMKTEDKQPFDLDFFDEDPYQFMARSVYGLKKYLLKEDPNFEKTIPIAKEKYRRMKMLHYIVVAGIIIFTLLFLWNYKSYGYRFGRTVVYRLFSLHHEVRFP